jgi:N-methylhydantoinase A
MRVGVDIGGTFTDFAVWRTGSDGVARLTTTKVPSTPPNFAEGFKAGMERVLADEPLRAGENVVVMHGTTVATNAVIERTGPKIALFVTKGFRDILLLQRLRLLKPIDLFGHRVVPLVPRELVFEIDERVDADGTLRAGIDPTAVRDCVARARAQGCEGLGVCLLHSFRNPAHEQEIRRIVADIDRDLDVSLSSDVWPRIAEYERAILALLNVYVRPRMSRYIAAIEEYMAHRLPGSRRFIMRSNGGGLAASEARALPVHTLLSGPASGVTAAAELGRRMGEKLLLTMDMGGTSTDISLIQAGQPAISTEAEVGDFPLTMPVTGIEAIGAGGGSIAAMDGSMLRVGPNSAGARPGPACFGHGGTMPTVTDAYLLCGYIDPKHFLGGRMQLDLAAAERAMAPLAAALGTDLRSAARAILSVATSNMVARVLPYLARQGVDPEDVALVLFGGAGSLHGPMLAAETGVTRVIVPAHPSVFCAYGGLVSDLRHDVVASVHGKAIGMDALRARYAELEERASAWLAKQVPPQWLGAVRVEQWAEMRYLGQSFQLNVCIPDGALARDDMSLIDQAFHDEHLRRYTHCDPSAAVDLVELRVRVFGSLAETAMAFADPRSESGASDPVSGTRALALDEDTFDVPVYLRERLPVDHHLAGPAIVEQDDTTIFVPARFEARVDALHNLVLTRTA